MDQKTVDRLEREVEEATAEVVARLGLKKLPPCLRRRPGT
jgi:hypothetical protein